MARHLSHLTPRDAFFHDPTAFAGYVTLMRDVFDLDVVARDALCGRDLSCRPFAFFDGNACVASVEIFTFPLVLEGARLEATALRSVAVAPAWRGRGLFRDLMLRAMTWCDAAGSRPMMLYAEEPSLYTRFGFEPTPQHKFVGPPPTPVAAPPARRLSFDTDHALIKRLLAERHPVSDRVAIVGGAALFLARLATDGDLDLAYLPDADALVVSEMDGNTLTLVDVVAAAMPSLSVILAALGRHPARVAVLFPPDRLDWAGTAEPEDAGLMTRAPLNLFERSFMFPPTAEF